MRVREMPIGFYDLFERHQHSFQETPRSELQRSVIGAQVEIHPWSPFELENWLFAPPERRRRHSLLP